MNPPDPATDHQPLSGPSPRWGTRALAGLLLVISAPLVGLIALLLLLVQGTPIFFGHPRVGLSGRTFRCWKFRTMVRDAEFSLAADQQLRQSYEANGYKLPTNGDPRVTRVGRWLRRTHLDELPQLLNVVRGEMGIVGPRPVVLGELAEFGDHADELLTVRPGIVGAWTSMGRRRPAYPERARVELEYVRERNPGLDALILLRSVRSILEGEPTR